jgi:hypothetical protein
VTQLHYSGGQLRAEKLNFSAFESVLRASRAIEVPGVHLKPLLFCSNSQHLNGSRKIPEAGF